MMAMSKTPSWLAHKAGISVPYASQLLSGVRKPRYRSALVLWRSSGIKFGDLADLDDATVAKLDEADRQRMGEEAL